MDIEIVPDLCSITVTNGDARMELTNAEIKEADCLYVWEVRKNEYIIRAFISEKTNEYVIVEFLKYKMVFAKGDEFLGTNIYTLPL